VRRSTAEDRGSREEGSEVKVVRRRGGRGEGEEGRVKECSELGDRSRKGGGRAG
jgi:hypothetical protein